MEITLSVKDPEKRYSTVSELVNAVASAIENHSMEVLVLDYEKEEEDEIIDDTEKELPDETSR